MNTPSNLISVRNRITNENSNAQSLEIHPIINGFVTSVITDDNEEHFNYFDTIEDILDFFL